MSVFTSLEKSAIQSFLDQFDLGTLVHYEGAAHGIENTNYFIVTQDNHGQQGNYVLTLFEQLEFSEIPFYLELLESLQHAGIAVPAAIKNQRSECLFTLAGKPCILVPRFNGRHVEQSSPAQCQQVGQTLAKIHKATQALTATLANDRDLRWMQSMQTPLASYLGHDNNALLTQELAFYQQEMPQLKLPQGVIHSDLFRDNALFEGEQLSGVIDFYNACTESYLYDLAVTTNDWCINDDGTLAPQRAHALISAYHQERPLSLDEQRAWPLQLRFAASRFWLSRLESWHLTDPTLQDSNTEDDSEDKIQIVTVKNPQEFERILRDRIAHPSQIKDFL